MFNHECFQRGGEVVGTCMDGFLFGACCQLKSDSQSHIPKGPGVVMTSYLDYPEAETETDDYDSEQLSMLHNSFKPVVTPGYRPGFTSQVTVTPEIKTTEVMQQEMISEGLSQITNSLLHSPPKDNIYGQSKPGSIYSHSSIDHHLADTILLNENGSVAENVVRPSDFNIQISSMQTKPTVNPISSTTTSTPKTVSTHHPVFTKPLFKPKPDKNTIKNPSTENYVMVSTVTKESQKITELSSIDSIIQMLNDSTPSMKEEATSPATVDLDIIENKSSPGPTGTVAPVSYSSGYPSYYSSTGHYVTVKPTPNPVTSYTKPSTTKRPYTTPNSIPQGDKPTSKPYYSSPSPSQSTSQAIDAFNRYPTDPYNFNSLTTFSYVSSSTTVTPTTTTRRPPSTSYVTGAKPLRRPVTPPTDILSSYDVAPDTFSSVTPTVIVLNGFQTSKPESSTEKKEPEFVEISQEPFKKPVSQITVNNHIQSTNNIYMGKPPQTYERPASPTVVITPKPPPITSPYPIKASTRPASVSTSPFPLFDSYTEYYAPTTFKPEMQTSPDDLINFPPVRNPMLNATGSNPALYNTSISLSDNDEDLLHDIEFTTPTWQEDEKLNEKMNLFVNKIVGSLQGTFQELHDIVILDKKPNATRATSPKPPKKPTTTKKPFLTTKKPLRLTTTTRKPTVKTTKKPTRPTTVAFRRTTTSTPAPTVTTTKKPVSNVSYSRTQKCQ